MGSAAAEFPTSTGGIHAQAGRPQPGESRQQHSEDSSMTCITGLDSLHTVQPFWTNPAITQGLIWAPKSTRSLTAVRNYSLKGDKADTKLIFQLFSMGS